MGEEFVNHPQNAINQLKNNTSGNISVKNGRLYNGGASQYTTIGTRSFDPEEVIGNEDMPIREVKNGAMTGNLKVNNGNIYVDGYGTVTLVE